MENQMDKKLENELELGLYKGLAGCFRKPST